MRLTLVSAMVLSVAGLCGAQQESPDVEQLRQQLNETRTQLSESVRQIAELRRDVDLLRQQVQAGVPAEPSPPNGSEPPTVAAADQDPAFLAAKVEELHQVKVESESRYSVKLSGLILFNGYHNTGFHDIEDLPNLTFNGAPNSSDGTMGATLRQSVFGVEVRGPKLLGAQSSGDMSVDFFGGSPTTNYGISAGLLRIRTANFRLDWTNTTVTIGQDTSIISPLSPTSYATVAEPALSWAGNLWVWTPQITAERRFTTGETTTLVLQGSLMDPLTEEVPPFQGRVPTAGERSGVPAVAGRIALDRLKAARIPFSVGFAGYRGRHRYQAFPQVDSWTINTDFQLLLGKYFGLSGEWYRGQAAGGLGGGIWTSVVFSDQSSAPAAMHPLQSTGGWAQLKFTPTPRFEVNAAFGQDENTGESLRFFSVPFTFQSFPPLKKNQAGFVNFVYKPNSTLLFAIEYRHLMTAPTFGNSASGDHINLAAGVRF